MRQQGLTNKQIAAFFKTLDIGSIARKYVPTQAQIDSAVRKYGCSPEEATIYIKYGLTDAEVKDAKNVMNKYN